MVIGLKIKFGHISIFLPPPYLSFICIYSDSADFIAISTTGKVYFILDSTQYCVDLLITDLLNLKKM